MTAPARSTVLITAMVGFSVGDLPSGTVAWDAIKLAFVIALFVVALRDAAHENGWYPKRERTRR